MKILVLGCNGFIGANLVDALLLNRNEVYGCDITGASNKEIICCGTSVLSTEFDTFFSDHSFDVCINASGRGDVGFSIKEPAKDFELNTVCVFKILDLIRSNRPSCKYIHISSAAVYGNPKNLPVSENASLAPLSPYGWHKLMSENICREYSHFFGIKTAIIRPFSVYGNGLKKQLLWDICTKLNTADSIKLFGTGNESRDFIHVTDLAAIIMKVINSEDANAAIYNAGIGEETSIKKIVNIFLRNYPGKKQISFSGEIKTGDPLNWRADIDRIKNLGFSPQVDLEQGIAEYIKWYKESVHEQ